jgi:hypothetical protein
MKHPCAGMTPAQLRDFELIAINQRPLGGYRTIDALKARGLVADGPARWLGRDQFGDITVPTWYVPIHIHMQWCVWCDRPKVRRKKKRAIPQQEAAREP